MRFRGKSIRRKIVALLLVPFLSLTCMWGISTVVTGREAAQLFSVSSVSRKLSLPLVDTVHALQEERRQTLIYLADPRAVDTLSELRRLRTVTNLRMAKIRLTSSKADVRDALDEASRDRLDAIVNAFDGLESLRRTVEQTNLTRSQALEFYSRIIDPCHNFLGGLEPLQDVLVDRQRTAVVGLTQARELLSREDALVVSGIVAGTFEEKDLRSLIGQITARKLRYEISLPALSSEDRVTFHQYWTGPQTKPLRLAEERIIEAGASNAARAVGTKDWEEAAGSVLDDLNRMDKRASEGFRSRVDPIAIGVIVMAAIAGVLGFLALLLSLFISVRVGRELIRDLSQLRQDAHEISGVRLPSVMRRLAMGELVDVETEAPRREYGKDEMGQVGQALNVLQRAAIEATVKQAEMRRGISEVFVNLARRNQVLLHRQLTLLDAMERRTEDTDELADLFRLDHLTTRMRRHAEGLVILSGAAPSRLWRKPVQLMDVVRAAVAEVEDYERIEVRRLPRLSVTGPAVSDLIHLIAELLENATVFSPPHTVVQVVGDRVANGFTLEIHDRGLGMNPDLLLDANLRLAETPEFEFSDTDRLGLFVVSRLAQRQNVRVSLQPSPYGGTTAVVFIPASLLTEGLDTNGAGIDLGRGSAPQREDVESPAPAALAQVPVAFLDPHKSIVGRPVELEGRLSSLGPDGAPDDRDRRHDDLNDHRDDLNGRNGRSGRNVRDARIPLPHHKARKLAVAHHPRSADKARKPMPEQRQPTESRKGEPPTDDLPRRIRQASLAPQLKEGPARLGRPAEPAEPDRDAEEVRSRMASLQHGWQRGRRENTEIEQAPMDTEGIQSRAGAQAGDRSEPEPARRDTAQGTTTEGDGR
jgi:hypothetical protein